MDTNDKRAKQELEKLQATASPQFKKQNLAKARQGLEESRQKYTTRPRSTNRGRYMQAGLGVVAAAAIGGVLLMSSTQWSDLFDTSSQSDGLQPTTPPADSGENNEEPMNDVEIVDIENLPERIEVEGADGPIGFELYDEEDVSFLTYFPEGMEVNGGEFIEGRSELISLEYTVNDSPDFLTGAISYYYERLPNYLLDELSQTNKVDSFSTDSWLVERYVHSEDFGLNVETIVGQRDESIFCISVNYPTSYEENWKLIRTTLLENWVWRDTGRLLAKKGSIDQTLNNTVTNLNEERHNNVITDLNLPSTIEVANRDIEWNEYELVDYEELSFLTYLPSHLNINNFQPVDSNAESIDFQYFGRENYGQISGGILYFDDLVDQAQLQEFDIFYSNKLSENAEYFDRSTNPWFLHSFRHSGYNDETQLKPLTQMNEVIIGQRGNSTFYIYGSFAPEDEDEWKALLDNMIENWVWKDTGESLVD